jgi:alpha-L-fucosidase
MKFRGVFLVSAALCTAAFAGTAGSVGGRGPEVRRNLERFRDWKFGLMIHFGLYSQLNTDESWALSDEDAPWSRRLMPWITDAEAFKRQYVALNRSFNPVAFDPDRWAETARRAGFKYVCLTAKHHDGFCLYDSGFTDYKTTDPSCPYSVSPHADIVRSVFSAFRKKGMGISCYFSKPDWHHDDYWHGGATGRRTTRMPSYDIKAFPVKWKNFAGFTRNQILELIGSYGPIDILWLDGGWISERHGRGIGIPSVIAEARKINPGLIAVDRWSGGVCEDITTPEQTVPETGPAMPWESCITIGTAFSYRYDDVYKSGRELIHLLLDVVAKGGNLALNVAPAPNGEFPRAALDRLETVGRWLSANGEAVYGTRAVALPRLNSLEDGSWAFTGRGGARYAIRLWKDREVDVRNFRLKYADAAGVRKIVHLASGASVPFSAAGKVLTFSLPAETTPDQHADVFRLEQQDDE